MTEQVSDKNPAVAPSALNAGLGEMLPKNAMFFHASAGTAKEEEREYEMLNDMSGTPIIRSKQTGNQFRLSWQSILGLAIEAGIDTPQRRNNRRAKA